MTFKELREASGMNKTDFAKYFGIPFRTIQNWEKHGSSTEGRKCPDYLLELMKYKLEKEGLLKDRLSVLTISPYGKATKRYERESIKKEGQDT